jgi:hypothetical protein
MSPHPCGYIDRNSLFANHLPKGKGSPMNHRLRAILLPQPIHILTVMTFYLLISWGFMRFLHYESQNSHLPPGTYSLDVVTESDYALLSDRSANSIRLSNDTVITHRSDAFFDIVLPNYIHVGDRYVHVATHGTSYFYQRWLNYFLPFAGMVIWALMSAIYHSAPTERDTPGEQPKIVPVPTGQHT